MSSPAASGPQGVPTPGIAPEPAVVPPSPEFAAFPAPASPAPPAEQPLVQPVMRADAPRAAAPAAHSAPQAEPAVASLSAQSATQSPVQEAAAPAGQQTAVLFAEGDKAQAPAQAPEPPRSAWSTRVRPWWPQRRKGPFLGGAARVIGLDAARGLALLGMVVAHAAAMDDVGNTPRWLGFTHGRASILFAMIAGISLAIITGGSKPRQGEFVLRDRLRIFTRAVVLLIIASILESVGTPVAIILGSYALWFVLSLPFVQCRVRTLLIWGASFAALGGLVNELMSQLMVRYYFYLGAQPGNGFLTLLFSSVYPALVWMGFVLVGMAIGRSDLANPKTLWRYGLTGLALFAAFAAPFVVAEGTAPLLRLNPGVSAQVGQEVPGGADQSALPSGSVLLEPGKMYPVPGSGPNAVHEFWCVRDGALYSCSEEEFTQQAETWTEKDWRLFDTLMTQKYQEQDKGGSPKLVEDLFSSTYTMAPHSGSLFEAFSSGGFAMFVIAAFVAVGRRLKYVLTPLVAVGSMSLTAYSLHIVMMKLMADQVGATSNQALLVQVAALVVFGIAWALVFQRGPLEQAMASWADRGSALPRQKAGRHARGTE
ncbi:MAG: heparan-alpha-glucosaminide N-acetyltransferase domain-containing protein [Buchananella hordeovulneris]|nr:heparan-alpha-glucosaminide N-acetyltransferase domain-containing protein [Buchananella hordeovulneris]